MTILCHTKTNNLLRGPLAPLRGNLDSDRALWAFFENVQHILLFLKSQILQTSQIGTEKMLLCLIKLSFRFYYNS